MLGCNFKFYAVRRINWDLKTQYWNFWIEDWVDRNDFDSNCMSNFLVAENQTKEYYNAELVPLDVSVKEEENEKRKD